MVRLTVTDANNNVSFDFFEIKRVTCFGGGKGVDNRSSSQTSAPAEASIESGQVSAMPNPVSETFVLKGLLAESQLTILDANGYVLRVLDIPSEIGGEITVDVSDLCAGVYLASIKRPEQEAPVKIKFVKI